MAVVNRPVIGTVKCFTPGCDEQATVHCVERGARAGYLYSRCPECKCNQSTGALFQKYLRQHTEFRPEYQGAAWPVTSIHETEPGQTDLAEPDAQPVAEPETDQDGETGEPQAERGAGGAIAAGLGLIVGIGLIAIGVKK